LQCNRGRAQNALAYLLCWSLGASHSAAALLPVLKLTIRLNCDPHAGKISQSIRQLCRHALPVADMEATPHIGFLFALGAVWNINLNDCPGADALLCYAMRRDECRLPLDVRPTL